MAAAVAAGSRVVCVTATRGEEGSLDHDRWPPSEMGPVREAELHDPTISNDQGALYSETFEVVCHLVCGTRPKLDRGHLHREDGFVGDIQATHAVFSY